MRITGLNELRERLERLRPEEVMAKALAEQAQRMAARVREGLSEPPGGAGHDEPWLQSGALRNSVGAHSSGLQAAVGSSDSAAVPQELGTAGMPARPFLAPVAAQMGEEVARAVAAAVVAALRGDSPDAGSARVDLCGDGPDGSDPLYGGAIAGVGTPRTHDGGFMLASGKADGMDDPLRELRKDLGEETPEEEEKEIEHGRLNPLHVPGIPPGGGALPFGPRRPDTGSSPPASRTASPQPSPLAANRAEFEQYQQIMRERIAKPATTDPALSQAMNEMYRGGATVGSGSTAAAVRQERATGGTVGGRTHAQKAEGYVKFLERWLEKNPTASPGDRAAAENVLRDLRDALAGN